MHIYMYCRLNRNKRFNTHTQHNTTDKKQKQTYTYSGTEHSYCHPWNQQALKWCKEWRDVHIEIVENHFLDSKDDEITH